MRRCASIMRLISARMRFGFGRVDADAGAAAPGREREHVEDAASAGHDRGQAAGIGFCRLVRAEELLARGAVEQLDAALHRLDDVPGVDRARIGGVDEDELAGLVARPDRRRQRLDQRPQRFGLLASASGSAPSSSASSRLIAAHVLEPQDGASADDMAFRLDRPAVRAW